MNSVSDRLAEARRAAGFETATEAAENFGWRPSTYMGHENGSRGIKPDIARGYARAFGVPPEWLLFGRGEADSTPTEDSSRAGDLVPIFNIEVSAGNGMIAPDHEFEVDQLRFPPGYLRHITSAPVRNLTIVVVKGDSMSPTLREGDVVMIDRTNNHLGFDGLFVLRMDGALHVKRVNRGSEAGTVRILSDNRETYPATERRLDQVEAVGKVLWYGRKE